MLGDKNFIEKVEKEFIKKYKNEYGDKFLNSRDTKKEKEIITNAFGNTEQHIKPMSITNTKHGFVLSKKINGETIKVKRSNNLDKLIKYCNEKKI